MYRLTVLAVLVLVACASSSGVIPIGKDIYMVSGRGKSPGGYSGAEVKAAALREANQYCANAGKKVQVVTSSQSDMRFGVEAAAELQFMCLDSSDSDYSRTTVKKEADRVVEIRKDVKTTDNTPPSPETYDQLLKLDDLRKRGIITDAEFEAQKKKLLTAK